MTQTVQAPTQEGLGGPTFAKPTIHQMLRARWEQIPQAPALLDVGRDPLTYAGLHAQVERAVHSLRSMGVGRRDRVAMVLPNGLEMAVAFLAVSSAAASAPLNPAYGSQEFNFYLSDLNPKALLVHSEFDTPARAVAQTLGIPVVEISVEARAEASLIKLETDHKARASGDGLAEPDDVALLLHTSGTTSRPKLVPLTHTNLCTSAHNIRNAYQLTRADRCLNVMPLFHIHGLAASVLATLAAGGSVVCTPGFDASSFLTWLATFRPTWYTAVPTMHQALLAQAESCAALASNTSLRFIRSCSAALPPKVMADLEHTFGVPVLEAYGMTEAAHQMTSNPLPPGQRKPGSVGVATGPEVAVMDEAANLLGAGRTGEIVIRGASVTRGYDQNPEANSNSFVDGWFRTGDEGYLDDDGYLTITGRIKEIINRGGEKVAPREVDEALLEHPAVAQAVTFAVPHATLGEDVVAAVVLRDNASATEWELREQAFARLAGFKVPSQIITVEAIPKGPTGKLQRIGLAEKLANELEAPYRAPRNSVEATLASIWMEVLGHHKVGIYDNFFKLGGDSLTATRAMNRTSQSFGIDLPLTLIFQAPTIEQFARRLARQGQAVAQGSLVLLRPGGPKPPVFCLPGVLCNVFRGFDELAQSLGPQQPVYALQDGLHNPAKVKTKVKGYLQEVLGVQPEGPYFLMGECSGAVLAFEMAQQLQAQGQAVAMLALLEPTAPSVPSLRASYYLARYVWYRVRRRFRYHSRRVTRLTSTEQGVYVRFRWQAIANRWALSRYSPKPYNGRIDLFLASDSLQWAYDPRTEWRTYARGGFEVHEVPGRRATIIGTDRVSRTDEQVQALAKQLRALMEQVLQED